MRLRTGLRLRLRLRSGLLLRLLARLGWPVLVRAIYARGALITGVRRIVRVRTGATRLTARLATVLATVLAAGPWRRIIAPAPRVIPVVAVITVVVTPAAAIAIILIIAEREHVSRIGIPGSVAA